MAVIPGKKNFKIDRRADFPIKLTFKDSSGSAINLTGYTVAAQVYDESRSTKYADWDITYTDRANGIIDMNLTDTATATFTPNILFYDVLLTEPGGNKNYYLEGKLFISEGYTA
tara:strand:- start:129 stop:470 length:342 start_codon:yes stop_codon:yes gene_type:complete